MPLAREIKHTDAEQQARFAALTTDQKLLEVWLNTRETNGAVAQAFHDIETVRTELAEALKLVRADVDTVKDTLKNTERIAMENKAISAFMKKWGAWGTAAILFAVTVGDRAGLFDLASRWIK